MNIKHGRGILLSISDAEVDSIITQELSVDSDKVKNVLRTREGNIVDARSIGIYIKYVYLHKTYRQLWYEYHLTSTGSIQNNLQRCENLLKTDPRFREKYNKVMRLIQDRCSGRIELYLRDIINMALSIPLDRMKNFIVYINKF